MIERNWQELIRPEKPQIDAGSDPQRKARLVARQEGAGAQQLLLYLLGEAGLEPESLRILPRPALTESDVAAQVADGEADCGLAVASVARRFRLDFVPLARERFDLAVRRRSYFQPPLQALFAFARAPGFAEKVSEPPAQPAPVAAPHYSARPSWEELDRGGFFAKAVLDKLGRDPMLCAGELDYRVSSRRTDELGELTDSVNHMADSLQSMLEAKRQLLLAISHELRTPVTRAKLQLEFMEDNAVRDNLRDDIDEIDLLISDLIEAERLSGRHSALVAEEVDLAGFVALTVEPYESYEGGLIRELPRRDRSLKIDKLRLRLLLTNLLNNAIRYGRGNPITVSLQYQSSEAVLEVRDQGEGIAAEHLAHISEPFYRPDSSRQRHTGGFGLGLYLCRLIAEAHGGKLEIDSTLGKGTCVRLRLPL